MKRFLVIVLGAMLIAGCTQKKVEEKAEWRSVDPMEFTTQPIDLLANRWMALTVGNQTSANSMTIAWGSFGFLWNKPIVQSLVTPTLMRVTSLLSVKSYTQMPSTWIYSLQRNAKAGTLAWE